MPRKYTESLWLTAFCLFAVCVANRHVIGQDHVPFIAGFDRFGKHGEIDEQQSGALLIRELSCTACHASNPSLAAKRGPVLDDVANRLQIEWVERFLLDPHGVKPGTTMPDVLANRNQAERQKMAHAITAFLSTLNAALPEIKGSGLVPVPHEFWNVADLNAGQQLYHNVGCVACHAILQNDNEAGTGDSTPQSALDKLLDQLEPEQLAEMGLSGAARSVASVPLAVLQQKYTRQGLTLFLLDPLRTRPAGRMPNLKLAPVEAANIAGFLLINHAEEKVRSIPSPPKFTAEEIAQGRRWFTELQCVNCHAVKDLNTNAAQATSLAKLNTDRMRGCLSPSGQRSVQYGLAADQIAPIQVAIRSMQNAAANTSTTTERELQAHLLSFNCYACHSRGEMGGVGRYRRDHFSTIGNVDLGDEGRFPPPLDYVGWKLQTNWLKNVLLGKKADVRPHLQIRMPIFSQELSQNLPQLFAKADSSEQKLAAQPAAVKERSKEITEVGRQLMDVACVQCHVFNGNSLPGVVGVDLYGIDSRVRAEWFRDFLRDPGRLKARTRMPNFFPDGKSQRPDLMDGNVDMQIAAMWAYLGLKTPSLPSKIQESRDRDYELKPTDKPVVLRTFMDQVGTHAIAVGFPEKVHYAFDAEHMRLALGWHGKFLDAQGTWFVRFAPPAQPLGDSIVQLAKSSPFADLGNGKLTWPTDAQGYQFKGYRFDASGTPTLLYRFNQIAVEDRIRPLADGGLLRHMKLAQIDQADQRDQGIRFSWLIHSGKELRLAKTNTAIDEQKLQIRLLKLGEHSIDTPVGSVRASGDSKEWIVPIEVQGSMELVTEYRW